jgi:hypothetical protein
MIKKMVATLAVFALLVGALPGAAVASPTAWEAKNGVLGLAQGMLGPLQALNLGDHLEKGIRELEKGLDAKYWLDDLSDLSDKGKKAFDKDKKAAKEFMKAGLELLALQLAVIDRDLAWAAIDAASAYDTEKAMKHYDRGLEEMSDRPDKAIDEFKKAWEYAMKAIAKAAKESAKYTPGSGGDGITYSFMFIHRETGEFLEVSGSSEKNEGFLYHDRFAATDTYLGEAGVMQVHVSCSDAFPGGIGAKSDPAEDSQWLVAYADIDKGSKACHLIGTGDTGEVEGG